MFSLRRWLLIVQPSLPPVREDFDMETGEGAVYVHFQKAEGLAEP